MNLKVQAEQLHQLLAERGQIIKCQTRAVHRELLVYSVNRGDVVVHGVLPLRGLLVEAFEGHLFENTLQRNLDI